MRFDPLRDRRFGLRKAGKPVLPHALLLEAAEEPLDDPILLRRVGRDELLMQSVVATGCPKPPTLEDKPVITPDDRSALRLGQGRKDSLVGPTAGSYSLNPALHGFPDSWSIDSNPNRASRSATAGY